MKKYWSCFVSFVLFFSLSCGKKGPIYPPLEKIPKKVERFKAFQRGDVIVLEWRNPSRYIDGSPMSDLTQVELMILEEAKQTEQGFLPISRDFAKESKVLMEIPRNKFLDYQVNKENLSEGLSFSYKFKLEDIDNKKLTFGVRVKDERGKYSGFSSLISVEPQEVALSPQDLSAVVYEDRVEINWISPEENIDHSTPVNFVGYNIYRSTQEGKAIRLNSVLVKENKYEDKNFVFGSLYSYFVRISVTESSPFLESQDSDKVEVRVEDTFAPAPPQGLVMIAGKNFVSLSWNPSREEDLSGYKVIRRLDSVEEFVVLTPTGLEENSYTDDTIENNKRYEYAVTAYDKFGNESPKSVSVFVKITGESHENLSL